jgi:hypothetical protein
MIERQNEGLAENLPDGARFDFGTLWRRTPTAQLLPMRIQLTAGRVFHGNACSCARHWANICPGSGQALRPLGFFARGGAGRVPQTDTRPQRSL